MENTIHIAAISGSLRKSSYNTALLHTIREELLPEGMEMEILSIGDLPLYNEDRDKPAAAVRPPAVEQFRQSLAKADAYLIASPEYNYSIPGVLKNAIDWAFRGEDAPMKGKPVALIGATTSKWGTVRMQLSFLNLFLYLDMKPVYKPEVLIAEAKKNFDENGQLTDDTARKLIRQKLEALKKMVVHERVVKQEPVS